MHHFKEKNIHVWGIHFIKEIIARALEAASTHKLNLAQVRGCCSGALSFLQVLCQKDIFFLLTSF